MQKLADAARREMKMQQEDVKRLRGKRNQLHPLLCNVSPVSLQLTLHLLAGRRASVDAAGAAEGEGYGSGNVTRE